MKFKDYLSEKFDSDKEFIHKEFNFQGYKWDLVFGWGSPALFNWLGVDEMHGLSKKEAEKYNETPQDSFLAGLTNVNIVDNDKPFMYLNMLRSSQATIFHESVHLARLLLTCAKYKGSKGISKKDYVELNDDTEELFGDAVQYCTTTVYNEFITMDANELYFLKHKGWEKDL